MNELKKQLKKLKFLIPTPNQKKRIRKRILKEAEKI